MVEEDVEALSIISYPVVFPYLANFFIHSAQCVSLLHLSLKALFGLHNQTPVINDYCSSKRLRHEVYGAEVDSIYSVELISYNTGITLLNVYTLMTFFRKYPKKLYIVTYVN